ncbi:MAG TPA: NCS1 family transporter, partial [Bacillales bacterium]|nr:NCS1 family transporter [Bacillales bacterium]
FFVMWIGMAVVLAAFAIGGSGILHIPLGWVIVAGLFGSVVIGLSITITGDIGIEHGLSFPVYMRAPFGTFGTHIPSVVRGLAASFWFGLNTYFGATALNSILHVLWGFDHWFVCFLIFALVQLINTALGIKALEKFADLAAPVIIIISLWMYYSLSDQAQAAGRNVWAWAESPVSGGAAINAFLIVAFAVMGFWATLACDIPTISRFIKAPKYERNWWKRNKGTLIGSIIAMPLAETFMIAIGAVAYIAVSNSDPVAALQQTAGGWVLVILMIMIVFAQWSTNTTANVIPAATIFSNVGGPKVPFYIGVFIAGFVGSIVQPWLLFNILVPVLLVVGAILSAIVGILFADYYLIRKRRVNVLDLYESKGQFRYANGINWAGYISWVIGGLAGYLITDYSFIVGFVVGAAAYYFLGKYWWFRKYKQAELEDPDDEKYLGITVGRDWVVDMGEGHDKVEIS